MTYDLSHNVRNRLAIRSGPGNWPLDTRGVTTVQEAYRL